MTSIACKYCVYVYAHCKHRLYKTTYYLLYRYIYISILHNHKLSMLHQIYPAINYITVYLVAFTSSNFTAINNDSVTIDIYINDTHKQYTYTLIPQKVNAFIITDYIQFKDLVHNSKSIILDAFKVNSLHSFKVNYTSTTQLTAISMHSVHGNIPRDIMYIMFM